MTATTERPAVYSGFCGLRLGPASHARCQGVAGRPCACACHTAPPAPTGPPQLTGVRLPPLEPGSPAWLRTMSASKVAAVLGLSPYDSPFSLWHRMAGLTPAQEVKAHLARGHYLEPGIAAWFADQHPDWTVAPGDSWAHPEQPLFTASPDRLAYLPDGEVRGVEIKTAARDDEWGEAGTDQVPPGYRAQVQWQMAVTGCRTTHVAVLTAFLELREYVVTYDPDDAVFLMERAAAFLDSLPGQPGERRPSIDDHGATYEAVRQLHPDIDGSDVEVDPDVALRYLAAVPAAKAADVELTGAKAALLDQMRTAKRALFADRPIARRQPARGGAVSLYFLKDAS